MHLNQTGIGLISLRCTRGVCSGRTTVCFFRPMGSRALNGFISIVLSRLASVIGLSAGDYRYRTWRFEGRVHGVGKARGMFENRRRQKFRSARC